jgi:hypothetical protein
MQLVTITTMATNAHHSVPVIAAQLPSFIRISVFSLMALPLSKKVLLLNIHPLFSPVTSAPSGNRRKSVKSRQKFKVKRQKTCLLRQ